jgi:hypothetical protein
MRVEYFLFLLDFLCFMSKKSGVFPDLANHSCYALAIDGFHKIKMALFGRRFLCDRYLAATYFTVMVFDRERKKEHYF